jgi:tRNA dimethylallyltransferase
LTAPPKVVVITGPTASGKSALALALAETLGGTIINADSQQCYADLPLLSARPNAAEMARATHRLFGELGPLTKDSAPAWATRAATAIAEAAQGGSVPILVGGSGLYLHALMEGMPDMPSISAEVRETSRILLDEIGHEAFHERLAARDPDIAARLKPRDTQRILRAWEVIEETGRSLSAWQADPPRPPLAANYFSTLLMPSRAEVIESADRRFDAIMAAGAMAEVAGLLTKAIPVFAPVMRILGARPLARHLAGEIPLDAAVDLAKTATHQYAKRQTTWFRHQFRADLALSTKYSESVNAEIFSKIRRFLLT